MWILICCAFYRFPVLSQYKRYQIHEILRSRLRNIQLFLQTRMDSKVKLLAIKDNLRLHPAYLSDSSGCFGLIYCKKGGHSCLMGLQFQITGQLRPFTTLHWNNESLILGCIFCLLKRRMPIEFLSFWRLVSILKIKRRFMRKE